MAQKKVASKKSLLPPKGMVILLVALALVVGGFIGFKIGHKDFKDRNNGKDMWHDMRDGSYKANWRQGNCQALTINEPQQGQKATSPLTVSVTIDNTKDNCRWSVFEGQAGTIELKNKQGEIVGSAILTTSDDWMTDEPTKYSGTITFTPDESETEYTLVVNEENPSGQSGKTVALPLTY